MLKRRLCRSAILALILGLITTVAVAWFFAAFFRPKMGNIQPRPFTFTVGQYALDDSHLAMWYRVAGPARSINVFSFSDAPQTAKYFGKGDELRLPSWVSSFARDTSQHFTHNSPEQTLFWARGEGWPTEAMWCGYEDRVDGNAGLLSGGIAIRIKEPGVNVDCALPYYIIWPGFLIDAASYSALWFALLCIIWLLSHTRKQRRIRQGRCPSCGYDLRGSRSTSNTAATDANAVCPECGKHVAGE